MNEKPVKPADLPSGKSNWKPISFWRLAGKELRETLRDRRTISTLFLMPLIVYPILSLLFQGFLASGLRESLGADEQVDENQFIFLFETEEDFNQIAGALNQGYSNLQRDLAAARRRSFEEEGKTTPQAEIEYNLFTRHVFQSLDPAKNQTVQEMVESNSADVGVEVIPPDRTLPNSAQQPFRITLYFRDDLLRGQRAVRFFESLLNAINVGSLKGALRVRRARLDAPVSYSAKVVKPPESGKPVIAFAALIPLVLTLMTITGAVYPAIDLTAGERERGTLESLIAAPIPRMRILLGKLVAIVAVAMLTAVLNLTGMMVTLWVFQFDQVLFGERGITIQAVVQIFGLLLLFAIFFSSFLLVITSFARSFKEAQAYLIPVMLLALAPSLMSLKPDLELHGLWTVTPLVNIVLLARDVLNGNAEWSTALVTIVTTIFYSILAITMAARFFGTAKVLYGADQGIATLFRRPRHAAPHASASMALLCLALLFPASFLWQGVLVRTAEQSVSVRLWLAGLGLVIVFFLIPWLLARFHRVRFFRGFGIRPTAALAIVAGVCIGIGFAPLLMQAIAWTGQLLEETGLSNEAVRQALAQRGADQMELLRQVPYWLVVVTMAIIPAVCEELFFRGLLFQALRATWSAWQTILATAIMFGAFHLISSSGLTISRLLPTTIMGILLGWVTWRSDSVIPAIILHALHNTITVGFGYFQKEIIDRGWITEDQTVLPLQVLVGGIVLVGAGISILLFLRKPVEYKPLKADVKQDTIVM
ncbi:MAG: ABC transporter permease subunit/CPBP intramembrane protease [Pirellulaceae bacterium]